MHRDEATPTTVADASPGGSLTHTFVVRLWEPPEPAWGTATGVRGVVEHIQSGESVAFGNAEALLGFLQGTGRTGGGSTGGAS